MCLWVHAVHVRHSSHVWRVLWPQETQFVLAVLDYDAIEETLLRFSAGAVIKLLPKEGQDKGK